MYISITREKESVSSQLKDDARQNSFNDRQGSSNNNNTLFKYSIQYTNGIWKYCHAYVISAQSELNLVMKRRRKIVEIHSNQVRISKQLICFIRLKLVFLYAENLVLRIIYEGHPNL